MGSGQQRHGGSSHGHKSSSGREETYRYYSSWSCHNCRLQAGMLVDTTVGCPGCFHIRCGECPTTQIKAREAGNVVSVSLPSTQSASFGTDPQLSQSYLENSSSEPASPSKAYHIERHDPSDAIEGDNVLKDDDILPDSATGTDFKMGSHDIALSQ